MLNKTIIMINNYETPSSSTITNLFARSWVCYGAPPNFPWVSHHLPNQHCTFGVPDTTNETRPWTHLVFSMGKSFADGDSVELSGGFFHCEVSIFLGQESHEESYMLYLTHLTGL